jgi:hypothetical protein
MRHEVARIQTQQAAPRTTIIRISYQTPEWAGAVERGGDYAQKSIWLAGSTALANAACNGLFPLPAGKAIVVTCIASLLLYWLTWNLDRLLQRRRHRRGVIKTGLAIEIGPQHISAAGSGVNFHLPRLDTALFTVQPHRLGKHEEREERRSGRHPGYSYRDAFEVWLQMGRDFRRIAAVADEMSARAIVRSCQEADEMATRGNQQHSFASRNQPA